MKHYIDRADSRGFFDHGWLKTHHTFSFADYYNPKRIQFGALRVLNDDWLAPSQGFGMHPHKNMEVVSIPLKGKLKHGDSIQNTETIGPGQIQRMSAGTGIYHSEFNGSDTEAGEFLQIWILPDTQNLTPEYESYSIQPLLKANELLTFIEPDGPIALHQQAWMSMGTFTAGKKIAYTLKGKGTGVYLFVIEGECSVGDVQLNRRDGMALWELSELAILCLTDCQLLLIEVALD